MKTRVILLRGVMPTGKNKVLMAPLRAALEAAGLAEVRTYIQSGNVLAASPLEDAEVEDLVHRVIADEFGGDIKVIARPVGYLERVLAGNPFAGADTSKLYFTLLEREPDQGLRQAFEALDHGPDQVCVRGDMAYVLCATAYRDLKANNNFIERKLKLAATTRNFNTVSRLIGLCSA